MRSPDKALIVTILVPTRSDNPSKDGPWDGAVGTGCVVGEDLILTARHVVSPPERNPEHPIRIRWYGQCTDDDPFSGWVELEEDDKAIRWTGKGDLDAALLVCPRHEALRDMRVYRVAISRPPALACWESRGFPQASVVGDESGHGDFCGSVLSMGWEDPFFSVKSDLPAGEEARHWSGASGMPILVGERIVGIVQAVPDHFGNQLLRAVPTFRMLEDSTFCAEMGFAALPDLCTRARNLMIDALGKSDEAVNGLKARLAPECGNLKACREELANRVLELPLREVVDTARGVQSELRSKGKESAANVVARFVEALLPTGADPAELGKIRPAQPGTESALIRLDAHSPTLVEILMAAADGRETLFRPLHDRRTFPLGKACVGRVPEGGRDPGGDQRLQDITTELLALCEFAFSDDLDRAVFGHLKCILPQDWQVEPKGLTDQEREAFEKGLVRKINDELDDLAIDHRVDGCSFTYYLVVETPASLTDAEQARRDETLGKIKARFPQIAILCTAPKPNLPWDELEPFGNLRALLYKRPKSDS
ncbi:hypothetical protein McPS_32410 [Marichromatium sp. PS1]|uniref:hypothetical protein n=1 Tax=Marichromatium sp. PS1 TaxID=3138932 RepID=UPI0032E7BE79